MARQGQNKEWNNWGLITKALDLDIPSDEKLVLLVLVRYANKFNMCFPSIKLLTQVSGYCDRKVRQVLKELEKKGAFHRAKKGRLYHYEIRIESLPKLGEYSDEIPY